VQHRPNAVAGDLPGGLGTGKTSANHMDGLHWMGHGP
jgi:hypothetical protein